MTAAEPLTIGLIGAGRVGAVVAAALRAAGHRLVATTANSDTSRARAARLLPGVTVGAVGEVARAADDLLLIAVPDDVLPEVAKHVTGSRFVAHTSGVHGTSVLGSAGGLALHPAMTFTGEPADLDRLPGIAWGVTASDRAFAARLVADLRGVPEWIAEPDRVLYHAGLAHGANHLVTLVNEASDLLRAAGVEHPEIVLRPLLGAALDNALRLGDAALTGPVSRGDVGTVDKHLGSLPAGLVPTYIALARRTADRAVAAGRLRPDQAARVLRALAGGGEEAS